MIKKQLILIFLIYLVVNCKSDSNQTSEIKNESNLALPEIRDQADHQYELTKIIDSKQNDQKSFTSTFSLRREGDDIRFSLRIVNTISGIIKKVGKDELGDKFSVGETIITLIGVYGDDEKNESLMIGAMMGLERIILSKNLEELTIVSGTKTLYFKKSINN